MRHFCGIMAVLWRTLFWEKVYELIMQLPWIKTPVFPEWKKSLAISERLVLLFWNRPTAAFCPFAPGGVRTRKQVSPLLFSAEMHLQDGPLGTPARQEARVGSTRSQGCVSAYVESNFHCSVAGICRSDSDLSSFLIVLQGKVQLHILSFGCKLV